MSPSRKHGGTPAPVNSARARSRASITVLARCKVRARLLGRASPSPGASGGAPGRLHPPGVPVPRPSGGARGVPVPQASGGAPGVPVPQASPFPGRPRPPGVPAPSPWRAAGRPAPAPRPGGGPRARGPGATARTPGRRAARSRGTAARSSTRCSARGHRSRRPVRPGSEDKPLPVPEGGEASRAPRQGSLHPAPRARPARTPARTSPLKETTKPARTPQKTVTHQAFY